MSETSERDRVRVVIVAGAGGGIGRASAIERARAGWRVVLAGRTEQTLESTRRAVMRLTEVSVVPTDVTDAAAVDGLIEKTVAAFGRIDAVVNAAGVAPLRPIGDTTPDLWHQTIDVNLTSGFLLARSAWPHLTRRGGAVVFVSSMAARDPFPGFSAYAAAKAGIVGLTMALAKEGETRRVTVLAVAPGAVETAMFRQLASEDQYGRDKTLDPADVAAVIGDACDGRLRHASGETIYLRRKYG